MNEPGLARAGTARWSLFLPVMLAVAAGILVADLVRHVAGAAFGDEAAPRAATQAGPGRASLHVDDGDGADGEAGPVPVVDVGPTRGGDLVSLPGPVAAMRDGAPRACIGGTIALRRPNGWEQGLEGDVPLRCIASSQ